MAKTKKSRTHKGRIRVFPGWKKHAEEAWLAKQAALGWHLEDVRGRSGYVFAKGEKAEKTYAVAFGEREAADGWCLLAQNGGYGYYVQNQGEGALRPDLENQAEREKLLAFRSNMVTGLLLNLPGIALCLFYLWLFFQGGFTWFDLFQTKGLWNFLFLLLGGLAVLYFWKSVGQVNARLRLLFPGDTQAKK